MNDPQMQAAPGPHASGERVEESLPVVALVRDLMFVTRLRGAAKAAGRELKVIREPASLAPQAPGRQLIVDLNLEGALEAAAAWGQVQGRPVAGFVQHVDVDRIREAKARGIDPVVPRSRFDAVLPGLLT